MTTLADDIKALMGLGHSLENATELAVADRKRLATLKPAGNYPVPVNFIEQFSSHIFHIYILFAFEECLLMKKFCWCYFNLFISFYRKSKVLFYLGLGHTGYIFETAISLDFCRFYCWSHRPNSVFLFMKVKFWKVKYFFSSHFLRDLRPNLKRVYLF